MSTHRIKVGPNDPCPCGERKKYKNCCKGRFDWEQALKQRSPEIAHQLSVRGRNLRFFHRIYDLLQVDTPEKLPSYKQIKSAITPTFVERLHQSILDIWPASTPIEAVLAKGASGLSGLYIGDYQIEHLARGVKRHSLYSNKILLVDPFIYPLSVRPEFNPIQNPAAFRSHTLKSL